MGPEEYWPWVLGLMAFPVAAALILQRRPGNGVGRAMGVVAVSSLLIFGPWWHAVAHPASSWSLPAEIVSEVAVVPQFGGMIALLHLFPTGRPLHRKVFATLLWLMGLAAVLLLLSPRPLTLTGRPNPLGVLPQWSGGAYELVLAVFAVFGIATLLLRWRRGDAAERAQNKWFLAAAVVAVTTLALLGDDDADGGGGLLNFVSGVAITVATFWSLPAAIVVAVTRYRLYEIDRLISRTVSYALVVAVLAGVYAAGVLGLGSIIGRDSPLVVAASTLAAAALFNAVRRRVQGWVDGRFDRQRYDARRLVEGFSQRLRDEVRLEQLVPDLTDVVSETLRPASVSLWLRQREGTP